MIRATVMLLVLLAAGRAAAQEAVEEGGAALGRPLDREERRRLPRDEPAGEEERPEWDGPRVELGWARYVLGDGFGGGTVNAFHFGGYAPLAPFRLGAHVEFGVRGYAIGPSDVIFRATALAGYQQVKGLGPFVPYIGLVGTAGIVLGKRFHTPQRDAVLGLGFELGGDVALSAPFWIGFSFSYLRMSLGDLAYNAAVIRLRLGL